MTTPVIADETGMTALALNDAMVQSWLTRYLTRAIPAQADGKVLRWTILHDEQGRQNGVSVEYTYGTVSVGLDQFGVSVYNPRDAARIWEDGARAMLAAVDATGRLPNDETGESWASRWVAVNVGPDYVRTYAPGIVQRAGVQAVHPSSPRVSTEYPQIDYVIQANPNGVPDLYNVLGARKVVTYGDGRSPDPEIFPWQWTIYYNKTLAEIRQPQGNIGFGPGTAREVIDWNQLPPAEQAALRQAIDPESLLPTPRLPPAPAPLPPIPPVGMTDPNTLNIGAPYPYGHATPPAPTGAPAPGTLPPANGPLRVGSPVSGDPRSITAPSGLDWKAVAGFAAIIAALLFLARKKGGS